MDLRFGRARYEPPTSWHATIARVETYVTSSSSSSSTTTKRSKPAAAVVAVTTSDGIIGHGQVGSKDPLAALDLLWRHCVPAVLGRRLHDPFALVERMMLRHGLNYKRHGVAFNGAVAALDAAVWDAVGKHQGVPVCELFRGGKARPLDVYASSISRTTPPECLAAALYRLHRTFGVTRFKVKIGNRMNATPRNDPRPGRTFAAIEAAFGLEETEPTSPLTSSGAEQPPAVRFAVDANGAYDDADVVADVVHRLSCRPGMQTPRASFWFAEEPVPWMDYCKCHAFRRGLAARRGDAVGVRPVTVAGGEQEFRLDVWRRLMLPLRHGEEGVCGGEDDGHGGGGGGDDGLPFTLAQPDMGYCGGFSIAMTIAEMAAARARTPSIRVAPHSPQPDFHTIWAQHLLCSGVSSAFGYIEVACVNDGLAQMIFEEIQPLPGSSATDEAVAAAGEAKGPAFFGSDFRFQINRRGQLLFPGAAGAVATAGWGVSINEQWKKYAATRRSSDEPEQIGQWKRAVQLKAWGAAAAVVGVAGVAFRCVPLSVGVAVSVVAAVATATVLAWTSYLDALARDLTAAHAMAAGAAALWREVMETGGGGHVEASPGKIDLDACLR